MMTALHGNGIKLVLVEKLDRLARDLMVQETIIGDLRKHGFDLISVTEPDLLQDDPTRKLMRQIFGAIAEYQKTMIVLKLRGARQRQKAKTGRCEGAKPSGDLPGEKDVIARMSAPDREPGHWIDEPRAPDRLSRSGAADPPRSRSRDFCRRPPHHPAHGRGPEAALWVVAAECDQV
jgi:hypothetical protein